MAHVRLSGGNIVVTRHRRPGSCSSFLIHQIGGNTEERLKYKVLGARRRGLPALGPFNHKDGTGYVAPHKGDYHDAIDHRKAAVNLVTFESGLGGLLPFGARRLRRKAREAKASGHDPVVPIVHVRVVELRWLWMWSVGAARRRHATNVSVAR